MFSIEYQSEIIFFLFVQLGLLVVNFQTIGTHGWVEPDVMADVLARAADVCCTLHD